MGRFHYVVLTRCEPGTDEEFNRWYDDVHLPDVLAVPGIVGACRGRLADVQTITGPTGLLVVPAAAAGIEHPYLAIYSFDTPDPQQVLEEIVARAYTPRMMMSPTFAEAVTLLFADHDATVGAAA